MKFRILTLAAVVAVATLTTAALSPKTAHDVLTTPYRIVQAKMAESDRIRSVAAWTETRRRAEQGDPAAMYQVGLVMQGNGAEEWTGIAADSSAGVELIMDAAAANDLGAMVWVWAMRDGSNEGLVRLADRALELDLAPETIAGLADLARPVALGECDFAIRDAAARLYDAAAGDGATDAASIVAELDSHEDFAATFEARCSRS